MNAKTNILSAFAALLLSTVALGSAIAPPSFAQVPSAKATFIA